ncbi:hypothetical protein HDV00_009520, partial [Rhizophlyctis rosea]
FQRTPLSIIDLTKLHEFSYYNTEVGVNHGETIFKAFTDASTTAQRLFQLRSFSLHSYRSLLDEEVDANGKVKAVATVKKEDGNTAPNTLEEAPLIKFLLLLQQCPVTTIELHFLARETRPNPPIFIPPYLEYTSITDLTITSNILLPYLGTSMPNLESLTIEH